MSALTENDVDNMIRDARYEIRGEIDRAVIEAVERLGQEIAQHLSALQRVVDERTGHRV